MIYLLLTILLNTILFVLFKLFPKYKIDALQAIVVNYFTCVITGSLFLGSFPVNTHSIEQPWFLWSLLLGVMFIGIFNFLAYCTKQYGITTTTVTNKLSLVIPVVFSVLVYWERLSVMNIAGILLAFPAVYLATRVEGEKTKAHGFLIPALLFVLSGSLDTLMKYMEHSFLQDETTQAIFPIHIFSIAALIGLAIIAVQVLRKKTTLQYRNIIAGVLLGIPNYFSIYYFIRLLHSDWLQSSLVIPVNNIGIVVACAFAAIVFLKEPATKAKLVGLVLSIISIFLISYTFHV